MTSTTPLKTASYSNSINDNAASTEALRRDEDSLGTMYEYSPYPDLGDDLKEQELYIQHLPEDFRKKNLVYFDAGCGTGHYLVGNAKRYPHWHCIGIDLSHASLDIARKLGEKHNTKNISLYPGSYLDPLPFKEKPDIISAMGTVHHCADPDKAMQIMYDLLKDDGYLFLHMYGWRADREKFDIKEMLNILEPDLESYETRFAFYRALINHRQKKILKRIANTTLYDLYRATRVFLRNAHRKLNHVSWSPPWHDDYKEISSPWIDHFCNPCERAYEVPGIHALVENNGFKVYKMIKHGREFPQLIPDQWRSRYDQLGEWEKYRLSELLAEGGGSFAMILQKKR